MTPLLQDRRSVLFTLVLVLALFFNLLIFEKPQAEASFSSREEKVMQEDGRDSPKEDESEASLIRVEMTTIPRGSALYTHLEGQGISVSDSREAIKALEPYLDLRNIQAGQNIEIHYENNFFQGILIPLSIDRDIEVSRAGGQGFKVREHFRDLQTYPVQRESRVKNSLYASALEAGIDENIIMELIQLFSFDVDFQRDIHKGDRLKVCYEMLYDEEGRPVDTGNILYAFLSNADRVLEIYRYVDTQGKTDYYNPEGHTVRKTLLKTPINGAYITSGYGPRVSPITGYNSVHKGIDFGAPRGTPIKTSGDGKVIFAGYNKVYGNHVMVRHVNSYVTLYAHMQAFARGIRRGRIVHQGQVIGYVGTTGMSTGPHLHYEVRYRGRQINPASVKFPPGRTLKDQDSRIFQDMLSSYAASLN